MLQQVQPHLLTNLYKRLNLSYNCGSSQLLRNHRKNWRSTGAPKHDWGNFFKTRYNIVCYRGSLWARGQNNDSWNQRRHKESLHPGQFGKSRPFLPTNRTESLILSEMGGLGKKLDEIKRMFGKQFFKLWLVFSVSLRFACSNQEEKSLLSERQKLINWSVKVRYILNMIL